MNLVNQFGEGWLIPGEIGRMVSHGLNHIICLQPFGCIANHIVAKGVAAKLRRLYPELNLLFLDMDAGASEVNIFNRLEFLVKSVSVQFQDPKPQPVHELIL